MHCRLASLIPSLVKDGVFGDVAFLELQKDEPVSGAQCMSSIMCYKLLLMGRSGKIEIPLVVKAQLENPTLRDTRDGHTMFHNDVTMYKEVLPILKADQRWYPKMYHGVATLRENSDKDVVILENLTYKGYTVSKQPISLDLKHISLAIKRLAQFHSLSFILKYENKEKFVQLTKMLKPLAKPKQREIEFDCINFIMMEEGMKPFLEDGIHTVVLERFLNIVKQPHSVRLDIARPEDPFGVICHGDFNNNNLLFKYDDQGEPVDCVFYDFQLSAFANISIDLMYILYLNTTYEFRKKYWDSMLTLYWESLRSNVPNYIEIANFNDFMEHIECRAVYGYTICAFFLPALLEKDPTKNNKQNDNFNEKLNRYLTSGGEEAKQKVSGIVAHLLERDYISKFLNWYKNQKKEM